MSKQRPSKKIDPGAIVGRPIIFGEVLFDQFDDGTQALGGAPFNVAFHLTGFGLEPILVTRIGKDELGAKVRSTMQEWQMDCSGLQVDPRHPTGTVNVSLQSGQPSYTILANQAYDFIDATEIYRELKSTPISLLYNGTLALRNQVSQAALRDLRAWCQAPVFVDLNLRSPWWDADSLSLTLNAARWAKINEEECLTISGRSAMTPTQLEQAALSVREQFGLDLLVITLGEKGSYFVTPHGNTFESAKRITLVDAVGAGDAFSSVVILGLIRGWPLNIVQARATDFAATVCGYKGAVTHVRSVYATFLGRWAE